MAGGDYTYAQGVVIDPVTSELVQSGTGIFKDTAGGVVQDMFDLVGTQVAGIDVGPLGVHIAFKADIPHGVLSFGSVELPVVSIEAINSGLEAAAAQAAAEGALDLTRTYAADMERASQAATDAQAAQEAATEAADAAALSASEAATVVQPAVDAAEAAAADAAASRATIQGVIVGPPETGYALRTGRAPTNARPDAGAVGSGGMFFDLTLSKPIWSDGATWRDATGVVV